MKLIIENWKKFIENRKLLNEGEEVQDFVGGMVRVDQLKNLVLDDIKQCAKFAQDDMWEFQSLLRNISKRVEILAELSEDEDDFAK